MGRSPFGLFHRIQTGTTTSRDALYFILWLVAAMIVGTLIISLALTPGLQAVTLSVLRGLGL